MTAHSDRDMQEEVRRQLRALEAEVDRTRKEFDDFSARHDAMLKGGYLASARGLAGRTRAAHDAWLRAKKALRDFQQGRQ